MWQARENEKHKALHKSGKKIILKCITFYIRIKILLLSVQKLFSSSYVDVLDLVKASQFQAVL